MDKNKNFAITLPEGRIKELYDHDCVHSLNEIVEFLTEDIIKNDNIIWKLYDDPSVPCVMHLLHKARGRYHISSMLRATLEYLIQKVKNNNETNFKNKLDNSIVNAGNEKKIPDGYVIVALNYLRVAIKLKFGHRKDIEMDVSVKAALDILEQIHSEYEARRKDTKNGLWAKKRGEILQIKENDLEYNQYNNFHSYEESSSDDDV